MSNINHDFVIDYLRRTLRKNEGLLKELEEYAVEHHVPIVQPEVAEFLKVLMLTHKPMRILEVGAAIGYSSILMSESLPAGATIDTIERYDKMIEQATLNIERAGKKDSINLLEGDAEDWLKKLEGPYDLIFMDAAKGQYPIFFPECMRMLKVDGILISDNILYQGMVASDELLIKRKKTIVKRLRDYLDILCHDERLQTSILPFGDGVAVSYRVK